MRGSFQPKNRKLPRIPFLTLHEFNCLSRSLTLYQEKRMLLALPGGLCLQLSCSLERSDLPTGPGWVALWHPEQPSCLVWNRILLAMKL